MAEKIIHQQRTSRGSISLKAMRHSVAKPMIFYYEAYIMRAHMTAAIIQVSCKVKPGQDIHAKHAVSATLNSSFGFSSLAAKDGLLLLLEDPMIDFLEGDFPFSLLSSDVISTRGGSFMAKDPSQETFSMSRSLFLSLEQKRHCLDPRTDMGNSVTGFVSWQPEHFRKFVHSGVLVLSGAASGFSFSKFSLSFCIASWVSSTGTPVFCRSSNNLRRSSSPLLGLVVLLLRENLIILEVVLLLCAKQISKLCKEYSEIQKSGVTQRICPETL